MPERGVFLSTNYFVETYGAQLGTQDYEYISTELGIGADRDLVESCSGELMRELVCAKGEVNISPTVFFLAGHPGSGKSTTARYISDLFGGTVIHSDRIRGLLRDRGLPYVGANLPVVSAIRNRLIENIADGRNIIIDQFVNPLRAAICSEIVRRSNTTDYGTISILLAADRETLVRRLDERSPVTGHHTGKSEHLNLMGSFWKLEESAYDCVFNTQVCSLSIIGGELKRRLHND